MRIGTKSLLFGIHAIWWHPLFVAFGWWKLFGVPWDPRLWAAFIVHDWGYWGKADMDGADGELHPELGARIMHVLFDKPGFVLKNREVWAFTDWYDFTIYHSRFYAKKDGVSVSPLCYADKLAICTMPLWLYVPLARLSGELKEYMDRTKAGREGAKYADMNAYNEDPYEWCRGVRKYITTWIAENNPGKPRMK